jgi:hypothetical protein
VLLCVCCICGISQTTLQAGKVLRLRKAKAAAAHFKQQQQQPEAAQADRMTQQQQQQQQQQASGSNKVPIPTAAAAAAAAALADSAMAAAADAKAAAAAAVAAAASVAAMEAEVWQPVITNWQQLGELNECGHHVRLCVACFCVSSELHTAVLMQFVAFACLHNWVFHAACALLHTVHAQFSCPYLALLPRCCCCLFWLAGLCVACGCCEQQQCCRCTAHSTL